MDMRRARGGDGVAGRVVKNTVSQLLSSGLSYATKFLAAIVLARHLGDGGLGSFTTMWSVASMLGIMAVLGLDCRLIPEMARRRSAQGLEESLPLATLAGGGIAGLVLAVAAFAHLQPSTSRDLVAAGCYVALIPPSLMLRASFHARERMELETAAAVVDGGVALVSLLIVFAMGGGVAGAIGALCVGGASGLAVSLLLYNRLWGRLHPRWVPSRWPVLMRVAAPMALSYWFTTIYLRADILMLALLWPVGVVGTYSAAATIALATPELGIALNRALLPVFARAGRPGDPATWRATARVGVVMLATGVVMAVVLVVVAGPLVRILFGPQFGASAPVLEVLALVVPLRLVNSLLGT
ncbi:MAG: oligosaccharide flippase family protein, partial [Acidimicrobiales bacterium]